MLRKLKENIFPNMGGQVHNIVGNRGGFLPLERHVRSEGGQFDMPDERFKTANALALQREPQAAFYQQPAFKVLHLKAIIQRLLNTNHFVAGLDIQFFHRELAFEPDGLLLQMSQINVYWHKNLR